MIKTAVSRYELSKTKGASWGANCVAFNFE